MDNVNPPPHDPSSTQPFRFTPGWPGEAEGYGPPPWGPPHPVGSVGPGQPGGFGPQPAGGRGARRPGRHGRLLRWASGAAAVALLAAGGTLAGLKLAGDSAPAAANSATAAALNRAVGSPGQRCGVAAASGPRGSAGAGHCRRGLLRLVRGMHGQVAFHGAKGTVTLAFERGTIESAASGHLVVRAIDGTTWTWTLGTDAVIRSAGRRVQASALTGGGRVFVAGQVAGAAKDARLVIVRRASGGGSPGSSPPPAAGSAA